MPTNPCLRGDPILRRLPRGPAVVVEVGVFVARLSCYLLAHHRLLRLIAVDNWAPVDEQPEPYRATGDRHALQTAETCTIARLSAERNLDRFRDRVTLLPMSSVCAARQIQDWSCDIVFLDGDHSRDGVAADLEAWEIKVKPGGFIGGHDYLNPLKQYRFGVAEAVHQFVDGTSMKLELDTDTTWFCRM